MSQSWTNAFYDKHARLHKFVVGDKALLLLPSESNKVLLQWNSPYEVLEVVNVMNYKVNVKGVLNTYPANMLKLYVERQNMTSYVQGLLTRVVMSNPRITEILQFIGKQ